MKKTIKNQGKGITLIALIITIIVLLILAGVTIATLTGENGLLNTANKAVGKYSEAEAKEEVELAIADLTMAYYQRDDVQANETLDAYLHRKLNGYTTSSEATITYTDGKIAYTKDGVSTNMTMDANGKVTVDGTTSEVPVTPPTPTEPEEPTPPEEIPGTSDTPVTPPEETPIESIDEAQTDIMFSKTVNSELADGYGNKIVVPAGFKILNDSTIDYGTQNKVSVDKGIVIVDSKGNEFVWIPVPKSGYVYKDESKTAVNDVEIKLGRYEFSSSNGTPSEYTSTKHIEENSTDTKNLKNYGNTIAKNINNFKNSVIQNEGYYIGRYEARTTEKRSGKTTDEKLTPITLNRSDYLYNYVTQLQAANLARNMYDNTKIFTSDLMNSYAWDTATLFLQECGTNPKYSRQSSLNKNSIAKKGTNDTTEYTGTEDVQCNVYDMASNSREWTTETYDSKTQPGIYRGGTYANSLYYTSHRINKEETQR